jgi:hypothetical protein
MSIAYWLSHHPSQPCCCQQVFSRSITYELSHRPSQPCLLSARSLQGPSLTICQSVRVSHVCSQHALSQGPSLTSCHTVRVSHACCQQGLSRSITYVLSHRPSQPCLLSASSLKFHHLRPVTPSESAIFADSSSSQGLSLTYCHIARVSHACCQYILPKSITYELSYHSSQPCLLSVSTLKVHRLLAVTPSESVMSAVSMFS